MSRRMLAWVLACVLGVLLSGCVTTDELYAEYDATLCPIEPPTLGAARTPVALPSGDRLEWPPAVYFAYDDATVDMRAERELDDAILVLERFPDTKVLVTGFTSKLGSADYNRKLATRRVANVKAYLAAAGIGDSRTVDSALGEGLTDVSPYERVANAVNRRVGLTLLDVEGRPARHTLLPDITPSSWPVPPPTTLRAPVGRGAPRRAGTMNEPSHGAASSAPPTNAVPAPAVIGAPRTSPRLRPRPVGAPLPSSGGAGVGDIL